MQGINATYIYSVHEPGSINSTIHEGTDNTLHDAELVHTQNIFRFMTYLYRHLTNSRHFIEVFQYIKRST